MKPESSPRVAVLLTTYNGGAYVDAQIRSLKSNVTPFTLHWLDDHSTDNTRTIVRASALSAGIELREWHQPQHLGLPGAAFKILECVEADIYLVCDQDDIWQPNKIDVSVETLSPDIASPSLYFSDPLMFYNDAPEVLQRWSDVCGTSYNAALQENQMFMPLWAFGHTQAFTLPLRNIFLRTKDIACKYAFVNDDWLYQIAVACGIVRTLPDAPTTLYRRHKGSFTQTTPFQRGNSITAWWNGYQYLRRVGANHARGFILASAAMPSSKKLERCLEFARFEASLDVRQSPLELFRLRRRGLMVQRWRRSVGFITTCLFSNARDPTPTL